MRTSFVPVHSLSKGNKQDLLTAHDTIGISRKQQKTPMYNRQKQLPMFASSFFTFSQVNLHFIHTNFRQVMELILSQYYRFHTSKMPLLNSSSYSRKQCLCLTRAHYLDTATAVTAKEEKKASVHSM